MTVKADAKTSPNLLLSFIVLMPQSSRVKKWVGTEEGFKEIGTHLIEFGHSGKSCLDSKWHDLKKKRRPVRYALLCGDSMWNPTAPGGETVKQALALPCASFYGVCFFHSSNSLVFFSWWFSCVSARLPLGPPCPRFPASDDRCNQLSGGSKGTLNRNFKALTTLMRSD